MLSDAAKNLMLDALDATHVAAHSGFPNFAGNNELSGGSPAYARKSITFGAAASGIKASSNVPEIDAPADVHWLSLWTALSGGSLRDYAPCGADPKRYEVNVTTNKILLNAHPYSDDDTIVFYGGTPPGGLTEGTTYYVVNSATDDFEVSATQGGAAIDITNVGDDDVKVSIIVPQPFPTQGVLKVNDYDLSL